MVVGVGWADRAATKYGADVGVVPRAQWHLSWQAYGCTQSYFTPAHHCYNRRRVSQLPVDD